MKKIEVPEECPWCFELFDDEEKESPRLDCDGEPICDDCYKEHYQIWCPVCEESFDKEIKNEDYFFAITREAIDSRDTECEGKPMAPGIYHPTELLFYSADLVFGFSYFYPGSIKLIKEIDFKGCFCEPICPDCVEKYVRGEQ